MEIKEIKTKSYKDVHAEVEQEAIYLETLPKGNDFSQKGKFLTSIGLSNSIATKMYMDISSNEQTIKEIQKMFYGTKTKFLLRSQVERLLEKYNLFLRDPEFFLGDIPELNIKDLQNFKVPYSFVKSFIHRDNMRILDQMIESIPDSVSYVVKNSVTYIEDVKVGLQFILELSKTGIIKNKLLIAAVEGLFSQEAFSVSKARILNKPEISPKFEVDLDPIIMLEIPQGYLIITAWGDEANDELVVNQNSN